VKAPEVIKPVPNPDVMKPKIGDEGPKTNPLAFEDYQLFEALNLLKGITAAQITPTSAKALVPITASITKPIK